MKKRNTQEKRRKLLKLDLRRVPATHMMGLGFLILILTGTVLLMMPFSNADGRMLNFLDALFTATSASCVTGLVTIVPASQFTTTGKVILLILIQTGGLGIIICSVGFIMFMRRRLNLAQRQLVQQSFDTSGTKGMTSFAKRILIGTFLVEGIGAAFYLPVFLPKYGIGKGIWFSVFHAISAFCNAGIDLLGDNSFGDYLHSPYMNLVTAGLIIVSGLGYLVWDDTVKAAGKIIRRKRSVKKALHEMTFHAKLVYAITAILVFGGMLVIFLIEVSNPETIGSLNTGEGLVAAFFQSVTTRTAGFAILPQGALREGSKFFCCLLMFVGGSPGGTAGGMKTTTIAVVLLTCNAVIVGKDDTECFGRKIAPGDIRTALAVILLGMSFLFTGTILLCCFEPLALSDCLYEVTSAVATVGLTTGITPGLHNGGKLVIIVLMYIGRIGPMTLAQLLRVRSLKHQNTRSLPERKVYIG